MRTTLNIDDELMAEAKALAVRERTTVTRLIEEGLANRVRPGAAQASTCARRLPVFDGNSGMAPGVDPRSNRSMLDAADS